MPKIITAARRDPVRGKKQKKLIRRPMNKKETKASSSEGVGRAEKVKKGWNLLRGMHDILPKEEKYWKACYRAAEKLAEDLDFGRIDTPILEEANLFIRTIGKGTDVVDKEMYVFEDRDGTKVCLRPELTAAVARSYIMHGMWNYPQPVKLWYWGQIFRHERPQAGRYRQSFQIGFETLGLADPIADAELILLCYNFYKEIGLPVEIRLNSIGTPEERVRYKNELVNYYRSKRSYLCEECKKRLSRNPLRLLDCKEEGCASVKEDAPQIIDWLGDESKKHFTRVLEYLEELKVPYALDHALVRGLDYYTNTVFEVYPVFGEQPANEINAVSEANGESAAYSAKGQQSALAGGGRYNLLVESMGGMPTPAAGVALGVERAVAALRQYNEIKRITVPPEPDDIFFAHLGEQAKGHVLRMIDGMRGSGLKIGFNFFKTSLKNQLELANNMKVPYTLILGQKEVQEGSVIIRDMESGIQEIADQKKVEGILKKKLKKV